MKIAALREQTVLNAANGKSSETLDMQSLHLPTDIDVERLKLQLQMLGDAFRGVALCETVQDVAAGLSRLDLYL